MRTVRAWMVALAAACLVVAATAAGERIIEGVPAANGQINWSEGVLSATGTGVRPRDAESPAQARLLAKRAAIADAYRNMAHLVSEVRVTANTTVERYLTTNDTVRLNVEAYIRGARVIDEREDADGVYTVTLQLGMTGKQSLTGLVLPSVPAAPVVEPQPVPAPAPEPRVLEADLLTPADAKGPFTGLIIDTRGLNVQPAMSPRILDPSGKDVYTGAGVDADRIQETGVAGYMGTIRASLGVERVGSRPLVVRAIGTPDEFHRYVTISAADAERVRAEDQESHFLGKAAVILVVDERRARDEVR